VAVWSLRAAGYRLVGWFWFVGSLVPMIGLVQVGNQAMADRYAYLPLIGLFTVLTWELGEFAVRQEIDRQWCIAAGCAVLICFSVVTRRQLHYWSSSSALWTHTLDVTRHNIIAERNLYIAEDNLAYQLLSSGRSSEALPHFENAARLAPTDPLSHWALAASEQDRGQLREALDNYRVVTGNPQNSKQLTAAWLNMAMISSELGDYERATEYSTKAVQNDTQTVSSFVLDAERTAAERPSPNAWLRLGLLQEQSGQTAKAQQSYLQVIRMDPNSLVARELLDHLDHRGAAYSGVVRRGE